MLLGLNNTSYDALCSFRILEELMHTSVLVKKSAIFLYALYYTPKLFFSLY